MNTLLLDIAAWDLALDINGNIAVASEPYAIAQDVASAVRLFAGELWYDTTQGVPYFDVLGNVPNLQFIKLQIEKAALTAPGVVTARCLFAALTNRVLTGQVQIIDATGASNNVTF
jgi:hypothetical protein